MDITPLTSGLINSLLTYDILATAEDVADILWLSLYLTPEIEPVKFIPKDEKILSAPDEKIDSLPVSSAPPLPPPTLAEDTAETSAPRPPSPTPADSVNLYSPSATTAGENNFSGHQEKLLLTGASALPHKLEIGRKLRTLAKKIPSTTKFVVDELATVQLMADTGSLSMVYTPEKERWLNGILVVDNWPSMLVWEQTISELEQLFTQLSLFHTLRKYRLITDEKKFTTHLTTFGSAQKRVEPRELIDLTQRTIIFVISDCYSPAWSNGTKDKKSQKVGGMDWLLSIWGQKQQVVILNVLPEIQWLQTALSTAHRVYVQSTKSNSPNAHLQIDDPLKDVLHTAEDALAWPVITLEPDYVEAWAKFFDGDTQIALPGYQLAEDDSYIFHKTAFPRFDTQLWQHFRATTSPTARELTGYLAAVPLTLPIMRLVQHTMLPHSHQGHLAEILNSHLVMLVSDPDITPPNKLMWDFIEGAREKLLTTVLVGDVEQVYQMVAKYIEQHYNQAYGFGGSLLLPQNMLNTPNVIYINDKNLPFARIALITLTYLGYKDLAEKIRQSMTNIKDETKNWIFASWNERTEEQNEFWWKNCYVETPQLQEFLYSNRPVALVAPPYMGRTVATQALKRFQTRPVFIEYHLASAFDNTNPFATLVALITERLLENFIDNALLWENLKSSQIKFWHWLAQKYLNARFQRRYSDFLDDHNITMPSTTDEYLLNLNDSFFDDQKEICQDLRYLSRTLQLPITILIDFCQTKPTNYHFLQTLSTIIDHFDPEFIRFNLLLPSEDEVRKIIRHGRSGQLLFQYLEPTVKTAIFLAERYLQTATNNQIKKFRDVVSDSMLEKIEQEIIDIYGYPALSGWIYWAETLLYIKTTQTNYLVDDFELAKWTFYERHLKLSLDVERQGVCCGPKYIRLPAQLYALVELLFQQDYHYQNLFHIFGSENNLHQAIRRLRKEIEPNDKKAVYIHKHPTKGYVLENKI